MSFPQEKRDRYTKRK